MKEIIDENYKKKLLKSSIKDIDLMDDVLFETLMRIVFEKLGFEFEPMKSSDNYGASFVITKYSRKIAVRVVKLSKDIKGEDIIEKAASAKEHYKADEAWVITNGIFADAEKQFAMYRKVTLTDGMALTGGSALMDLVEKARKTK